MRPKLPGLWQFMSFLEVKFWGFAFVAKLTNNQFVREPPGVCLQAVRIVHTNSIRSDCIIHTQRDHPSFSFIAVIVKSVN